MLKYSFHVSISWPGLNHRLNRPQPGFIFLPEHFKLSLVAVSQLLRSFNFTLSVCHFLFWSDLKPSTFIKINSIHGVLITGGCDILLSYGPKSKGAIFT